MPCDRARDGVEQYQRPEHETGAVACQQLILWPLKTSLVIVMRNGVFGGRMLENFERCGSLSYGRSRPAW